jgi:hypothetical protein
MAILNGTDFKISTVAGVTASATETEVSLSFSQSTREVITKNSNGLRSVLPGVTSCSGSFSALLDDGDYASWQSIALTMTEAAARTTATFTIGLTGFQASIPGVLTELSFSASTEENTTVSGSFELNVDSDLTA